MHQKMEIYPVGICLLAALVAEPLVHQQELPAVQAPAFGMFHALSFIKFKYLEAVIF